MRANSKHKRAYKDGSKAYIYLLYDIASLKAIIESYSAKLTSGR